MVLTGVGAVGLIWLAASRLYSGRDLEPHTHATLPYPRPGLLSSTLQSAHPCLSVVIVFFNDKDLEKCSCFDPEIDP